MESRQAPATAGYESPQERRISVAGGGELAVYEWGPADGQPLLLVHATGFHGRCWDQVVAALPPGFRVLAFDMRGHGRSSKPGSYGWDEFGADLIELVDARELRGAVVAGHSMGGHCVVQLAAARPEVCARVLLIDPVIFDPEAYPTNRHRMYESVADHPVARRRARWESWEAMRDSLISKGAYGLWEPAVFEDYCRYGSLPTEGGVELACPPEVEASVYLGNTETDVHALVKQVQAPTLVLRAPPRNPDEPAVLDFSRSPTWPELAAALPQGQDILLEHLTHFIPMQAPALVAGYLVEALRQQAAA